MEKNKPTIVCLERKTKTLVEHTISEGNLIKKSHGRTLSFDEITFESGLDEFTAYGHQNTGTLSAEEFYDRLVKRYSDSKTILWIFGRMTSRNTGSGIPFQYEYSIDLMKLGLED